MLFFHLFSSFQSFLSSFTMYYFFFVSWKRKLLKKNVTFCNKIENILCFKIMCVLFFVWVNTALHMKAKYGGDPLTATLQKMKGEPQLRM